MQPNGCFVVNIKKLNMKKTKTLALLALFYVTTSINVSKHKVSWYHSSFHGKKTTSGEIYDKNKFTCASNIHPFGSMLLVTNISNHKQVLVKVNDRGQLTGRTLDLSEAAFKTLAPLSKGVIIVNIEKQ